MIATIEAAELAKKSFPPVNFTVSELLPHGLVLLVGKPKQGKSLASTQLGLAVATGGTFLSLPTTIGEVLYVGIEDSEQRLQERLIKQYGSSALPSRLHIASEVQRLLEGLEEGLEEWRVSVPSPQLVIIDTLGHVVPDRPSGRTEYQHYVTVLARIRAWAQEQGLTVLFVHHERKSAGVSVSGDPFDGIMGSQAIFGAADTAMILSRERGGSHGQLLVTGRDVEDKTYGVYLDRDRLLWMNSTAALGRPLGLSHREAEVVQAIGFDTVELNVVAATVGIATNQAANILRHLVEEGIVEKPSHGTYKVKDGALADLAPLQDEKWRGVPGGEVNELCEDYVEEALDSDLTFEL